MGATTGAEMTGCAAFSTTVVHVPSGAGGVVVAAGDTGGSTTGAAFFVTKGSANVVVSGLRGVVVGVGGCTCRC